MQFIHMQHIKLVIRKPFITLEIHNHIVLKNCSGLG